MSVVGSNTLAGASGQGGGGYVIEKSLRFNDGGSAYLNRTPSSTGNTTTWTFSCWVKRAKGTESYPALFSAGANSQTTGFLQISFEADEFSTYMKHSGGTNYYYTNALLRDNSAWYHLVVAMDTTASAEADRVKMYVNGVEQTFRNSSVPAQNQTFLVNDTAHHQIGATKNSSGTTSIFYAGYMADVHLVDGQALDPTSFGAFDDNGVWQAAEYTGSHGTNGFHLDFADGNDIGNDAAGSNNWSVNNLTATGGTVNYVDSISGSPYIPINAFSTSYISNYINTSTWAITTTAWDGVWDASQNTNVFTPTGGIAVSSSLIVYYGNYNNSASTTTLTITYTDSSTETDTFTSGNNNWMGSFTASNASGKTIQSIQVVGPSSAAYQSFGGFVIDGQILTSANPDTDILRDSPTNGDATADTGAGGEVSANYCTINPLANGLTLTDGNLTVSQSSAAHNNSKGTIGVSSGKWYWEVTKNDGNNSSSTSIALGVAKPSFTLGGANYIGHADTVHAYMQSGVGLYDGDGYSQLNTSLGSGVEHTTGTWMLAFDFDAGKGWIGKDGTWLSDTTAGNEGNPANGSNPTFNGFTSGETYVPLFGMYAATSITANFGQRAWKYEAPSGFKALCTANLPTPTIADGSDYFDAKIWTGTGSTKSITGYEFSPDFVWIKNRTDASSHHFYDIVRGVEKRIASDSSAAEDDFGSSNSGSSLTSFNSDGFTVGDFNGINGSSDSMVGWAWDAGGSTASNTDGDVTSSVRANTSAGFSIVKWNPDSNGQSVGHGLNAAPEFIMAKALDNGHSWRVYHKSLSSGKNLLLDSSDAEDTYSADIDTVSSTVFDGGQGLTGTALNNNIAYCFTSVAGYSAFGSYTGNGNTDGPFVYTGFRPALVIVKNKTTSASWCLWDSKRPGYNLTNDLFNIDNSNAEADWAYIDVLSNGFKVKGTHAVQNTNSDNYIYAAFAENPFQANGGLAR